jgi:predicted phosphodiesterase
MVGKVQSFSVFFACGILVSLIAGLATAQSSPVEKDKPFTIAIVSSSYEDQDILARQAKWIQENVEKMGIVLVIHTGDAVQNNTRQEWDRVSESMSMFEGVVPYLLVAGNHESFVNEGKHVSNRDTTMLNKYMPVSRYSDKTWYGGCMDGGSENMFFSMDIEDMKFLLLSIEFAPRVEVLDWANKVVSEHKDHRTIVVTHSYLQSADSKFNFKLDPLKYNKENTNRDEMWERFVSQHQNIFLVLSSHYFAVRRETSIGKNGNMVHQVMACYLNDEDKLKGWLRIAKFCPKQDKIRFTTYSPLLDKSLTGEQNQFELEYKMN